tara:strand:+ start:161 stop:487 length:327 start_codon:yes stop_codon:yes gene_type:complete
MKSIEASSFNEMFKVLMKGFYKGKSLYAVTELTGLSNSTINNIVSGEVNASEDVIKAMCIPAGMGLHHVLSARTEEELNAARALRIKQRAAKKRRRNKSKSLIKGSES